MLETLIGTQKRLLLPDSPTFLFSQYMLALAYYDIGQYERAVEIPGNVVAIGVKTLAPKQAKRLRSQLRLASTHLAIGKNRTAIRIFEEVIEIRAQTLDPENSDRRISADEVVDIYSKEAHTDWTREVDILEKAISINARTLGTEHSDHLASLCELARAYQASGEYETAVEILKKIIKVKARKLEEPDHPECLKLRQELPRAWMGLEVALGSNEYFRGGRRDSDEDVGA